LIYFSELKFIIKDFEITKTENKKDTKYNVKIGIYFLGKIPILFINLSNEKASKFIKKSYVDKLIKNFPNISNNKIKLHNKSIWNLIRKKGKITSFKLKVYLDTENVVTTSYLVGIISIIVPNLLRGNIKKVNNDNFNFKIQPLYRNNQNFIYLKLNSIFSIKLVHIINMLKVMGGSKDERTSNRKLNVNCYGKY
jgi:hypothetical protein